ncbi:MAG TPA: undecaprenyldiphospho-muramoylpentapeptide beta-N-acetylglucosaminyltransferase [Nevskiaceae bacterium]|nr:undecaprenyldiphospho-muramoylpentapeptide beta-N-acetylglucosaminyltransferase [Nevskiaceae bacterium]
MKFVIMAGGTGGHVFPALAVAHELRRRGHEVVWMGAPDSFEARTVPPQGFPIEFVRVTGLRGKGAMTLLGAPLKLLRAVIEAGRILARHRPVAVLGMGGFASGPGGLAAWLKRVPLVIHEQNAAPGLTNRLLARIARVVLEAFPDTFRGAQTVGNPVRAGFVELPSPAARIGSVQRPARILVLGGSQGARALNERVPQALALIPVERRPVVRHQAGRTLEIAQKAYAAAGVDGTVEPFITDMPAAYAWADLVVCRSGASTVAELSASGSAALLVPFPFAVDDHQTRNGEYLVRCGAARLVQEADLTPARLAAELEDLLSDRPRLVAMGDAARGARWDGAAETIADACLRVATQ